MTVVALTMAQPCIHEFWANQTRVPLPTTGTGNLVVRVYTTQLHRECRESCPTSTPWSLYQQNYILELEQLSDEAVGIDVLAPNLARCWTYRHVAGGGGGCLKRCAL